MTCHRWAGRRSTFVSANLSRLAICLLIPLALTCQRVTADDVLPPFQPLVRLPTGNAGIQGFTATVKIADQNIAGYVPVELTITSTIRFTADRNFRFEFTPPAGSRMPPERSLAIAVPMSVRQGTRSHSIVRYLPKWSAGHAYRVRLYESGERLAGYEAVIGDLVIRDGSAALELLAGETRTDWLLIGQQERLTDLERERLDRFATMIGDAPRPSGLLGIVGGADLQGAGQSQLPTDWRGYQRYDVVLMAEAAIDQLAQQPAAFAALRDWILNGGVLIAFDVSKPPELFGRLDFRWTADQRWQAEMSQLVSNVLGSLAGDESRQLRKSFLEEFLAAVDAGSIVPALPSAVDANRAELAAIEAAEKVDSFPSGSTRLSRTADEWSESIVVQPAGAGLVVARTDDFPEFSPIDWQLIHPVIDYRRSPTLRRGVDPLLGDIRFSQWLIPGVAEPPVYTFMGLLTVFVILVGPVAYRYTTRRNRGYLMFAIAPALALLTTLAMFSYGIVADGFGTVARVRQLTWVDGASGDAGERTRSTYFAGVRPGAGLRFPGEAEVIGYPQSSGSSWDEVSGQPPAVSGQVIVTDEQQRFESGFLPSRRQKQFVVHQPRRGFGKLQLLDAPAGKQFTNQFDFPLRLVVARDSSGNYFSVSDLQPGESRPAESLLPSEGSKLLGYMYTEYQPLAAVREARQSNDYRNRVRDLIVSINRTFGDEATFVNEGSFEFWIREHLQLLGNIPNDHFVATAEVSDDVLAVDETELVDSIRYIFGTLP